MGKEKIVSNFYTVGQGQGETNDRHTLRRYVLSHGDESDPLTEAERGSVGLANASGKD